MSLIVGESDGREEARALRRLIICLLNTRSFSRLTAYEASRILHRLGADVRVFDPHGLPVKDDVSEQNPKVQELRSLVSSWAP